MYVDELRSYFFHTYIFTKWNCQVNLTVHITYTNYDNIYNMFDQDANVDCPSNSFSYSHFNCDSINVYFLV